MAAPDLSPFADLASAARAIMSYLQEQLGLGLWMFTRVEGDAWIVLDTLGAEYAIPPGAVLRWSDSFCSRLVAGEGPMLAPRAMEIPAYAAAPVAKAVQIESYVGLPIYRNDGSLFGTMCAIDKKPAEGIEKHQPLVELLARLLGFAVDRQREADEAARRAERAENEALTDSLTGIFNRRGWDQLVGREEERCRRYGYPACAFVVDLDGFKEINDTLGHATGDEVLQRVATCLSKNFRGHDVVARTGGDEFSVLAVECDEAQGQRLLASVNAKLATDAIPASVGFGYKPAARLVEVWKAADEAMYLVKKTRKFHAVALSAVSA